MNLLWLSNRSSDSPMLPRIAQVVFTAALAGVVASLAVADEKPLAEDWDYVDAMKKVEAKFHGRPGVVVHIGDSITYSNPYGQWARGGQGKSDADKAILSWMHCGKNDDTDGWWLARFDHPSGGRSYTAAGGLRVDESLAGGKQGLPPLAKLLDEYRPQIVVYMLGTNDVTAGRSLEAYRSDVQKSLDLILARGIIPIVSTIPPHPAKLEKSKKFNVAIREVAKANRLPLIDYEREILVRRPDDWNGTLLNKNDVHPTTENSGVKASSAPTSENLRNSGYLLRGWLSVKKIAEVKDKVIERAAQ
jgi:GDSL-like lipase/acylhydrolase family protein